jgi:hypothetical protein
MTYDWESFFQIEVMATQFHNVELDVKADLSISKEARK